MLRFATQASPDVAERNIKFSLLIPILPPSLTERGRGRVWAVRLGSNIAGIARARSRAAARARGRNVLSRFTSGHAGLLFLLRLHLSSTGTDVLELRIRVQLVDHLSVGVEGHTHAGDVGGRELLIHVCARATEADAELAEAVEQYAVTALQTLNDALYRILQDAVDGALREAGAMFLDVLSQEVEVDGLAFLSECHNFLFAVLLRRILQSQSQGIGNCSDNSVCHDLKIGPLPPSPRGREPFVLRVNSLILQFDDFRFDD